MVISNFKDQLWRTIKLMIEKEFSSTKQSMFDSIKKELKSEIEYYVNMKFE